MSVNLALFCLLGWTLMALGLGFAIRSYRDSYDIQPAFPRDAHMKWLLRGAFVAYILLGLGQVAFTVGNFSPTSPSIDGSVARPSTGLRSG